MIARLRLLVIVVAAAISWTAAAQQPPSPSAGSGTQNVQSAPVARPEQKQPAQNNQDAARQPAVEHHAAQPPNHQEGGGKPSGGRDGNSAVHQETPKPEDVTAEYTVYLVFATIALVVATIVLAVATVGLYRQTKRLAEQAVEASKDTKRSIAIAEEAGIETARAAQAALDSIGTERAWMCPIEHSVSQTDNLQVDSNSRGPTIIVYLIWTNAGRSPALNLGARLDFKIIPIGDADTIAPLTTEAVKTTVATVAPGGKIVVGEVVMSGRQREDIINGKSCVSIAMEVKYNSIYHNDQKNTIINGILAFKFANQDDQGRIHYHFAFSTRGESIVT